MEKSSVRQARREREREAVKAGEIAPKKRRLNPQEIIELQEMHRIASARALEANQAKQNTALFPRSGFLGMRGGKQVAAELDALARLLDNVKRKWVADRLVACGYLPGTICEIDMSTGEITPTPPKA